MVTERDGTDTRPGWLKGIEMIEQGAVMRCAQQRNSPAPTDSLPKGRILLGLLPLQLDPLLQVQRIARITDVVEVFDRIRHARRVVQAPVRRSEQDSRAHVSIRCNVELP